MGGGNPVTKIKNEYDRLEDKVKKETVRVLDKAGIVDSTPDVNDDSQDKQYAQDTQTDEGVKEDKKKKFSKSNRAKSMLRTSPESSGSASGANV